MVSSVVFLLHDCQRVHTTAVEYLTCDYRVILDKWCLFDCILKRILNSVQIEIWTSNGLRRFVHQLGIYAVIFRWYIEGTSRTVEVPTSCKMYEQIPYACHPNLYPCLMNHPKLLASFHAIILNCLSPTSHFTCLVIFLLDGLSKSTLVYIIILGILYIYITSMLSVSVCSRTQIIQPVRLY
jgi:hypothetical protein